MDEFPLRHSRILALSALLLSAGCALIVELPDPPAEDGGSVGNASGGEGGAAAASAGGSEPGAPPPAGGSGGAEGCIDPPCDCDGDGHDAAGGGCGGDDCDDNDPRVYPGQTRYFAERASPEIGFDYNCSGSPEKDPSLDVVISCETQLVDCGGEGYRGQSPGCGEIGEWGRCSRGAVTCEFQVVDPARVMRCR